MISFGTLFHDKIFSLTFPWLLTTSLTFPWHVPNSLTFLGFPIFPDKWSPWIQERKTTTKGTRWSQTITQSISRSIGTSKLPRNDYTFWNGSEIDNSIKRWKILTLSPTYLRMKLRREMTSKQSLPPQTRKNSDGDDTFCHTSKLSNNSVLKQWWQCHCYTCIFIIGNRTVKYSKKYKRKTDVKEKHMSTNQTIMSAQWQRVTRPSTQSCALCNSDPNCDLLNYSQPHQLLLLIIIIIIIKSIYMRRLKGKKSLSAAA